MCRVVRRSQSPLLPSGISRVAKKAIYLGQVEAADAETAIKAAINKFDIEPEHQGRLAARRIVTAE